MGAAPRCAAATCSPRFAARAALILASTAASSCGSSSDSGAVARPPAASHAGGAHSRARRGDPSAPRRRGPGSELHHVRAHVPLARAGGKRAARHPIFARRQMGDVLAERKARRRKCALRIRPRHQGIESPLARGGSCQRRRAHVARRRAAPRAPASEDQGHHGLSLGQARAGDGHPLGRRCLRSSARRQDRQAHEHAGPGDRRQALRQRRARGLRPQGGALRGGRGLQGGDAAHPRSAGGGHAGRRRLQRSGGIRGDQRVLVVAEVRSHCLSRSRRAGRRADSRWSATARSGPTS